MNRDVQEAHLVMLGWRPAKFKPTKYHKGWIYGVRSDRQWCGESYGKMCIEYLSDSAICVDIEWWVIRDDILRQITHTVDASVGGWDGCD